MMRVLCYFLGVLTGAIAMAVVIPEPPPTPVLRMSVASSRTTIDGDKPTRVEWGSVQLQGTHHYTIPETPTSDGIVINIDTEDPDAGAIYVP